MRSAERKRLLGWSCTCSCTFGVQLRRGPPSAAQDSSFSSSQLLCPDVICGFGSASDVGARSIAAAAGGALQCTMHCPLSTVHCRAASILFPQSAAPKEIFEKAEIHCGCPCPFCPLTSPNSESALLTSHVSPATTTTTDQLSLLRPWMPMGNQSFLSRGLIKS